MTDESLPASEQAVVDLVRDRAKAGKEKYGVTTDRDDLSVVEWLDHQVEELLDAAIYNRRVRAALEQQRGVRQEGGCVNAKPAQWEHKIYPNGGQEWCEERYGFVIEYDDEEDPEFRYSAAWGEEVENFPTLKEAQSWCQKEVDSLVREWAMLAAPNPDGGNDEQ